MTDTLQERLRYEGAPLSGVTGYGDDMLRAANRLDALEAEVARLREALQKIQRISVLLDDDAAEISGIARAALQEPKGATD